MTVKGDQLHRIMLHSVMGIGIVYTIFNFLNHDTWETITTACLVPSTFIAWMLFRYGFGLASKMWNLVQVNAVVTLLTLITGAQTFVEIFFIPIIIGALIVLQGRERDLGYMFAALSLLLMGVTVTSDLHLGHGEPMAQAQLRMEWILNGVGACTVVALQVIFIMRTNDLMNHQLIQRTEELKSQHEHLTLTIQTRDKMMSILSHDMRAPLHLLRSGLDMLKPGNMPADKQVELVSELGNRTRHTVDLLDNLLRWSHDHAISSNFKLECIRMEDIRLYADECFILFGREKDIRFRENITVPAGTQVYCDLRMVQTVMRNLITNAFKFTPTGGEVTVTGYMRGEMTELRITNTGNPMDPVQVERILKGESFTLPGTNAETGHGLGLQLVQDLLHLHGSHLGIETGEATGTSFFFCLPTC